VLDRACALGWLYALAVVVLDDLAVPRLRPGPPVPDAVTAIVPARDEARDVEATLRALVAQQGAEVQVVAVDEESRDGTLAAMRRVDGVEVVQGRSAPAGWLGKPWACAQGVARARGDWLLFVDADVRLAPWAVAAALRLARGRGGGGATAFPHIEAVSVAERLVLPAAGLALETVILPGWLASLPRSPVAVGVGGFLLVRREAYERVGGHAAVAGEVVEDLALARRLKRAGTPLAWARGDEAMRLRMYHGLGELWRGWRKNAARAWSAPAPGVAAGGAALLVLVVRPWVAAARRRPAGLVALLAQVAALRRSGRVLGLPARYALTAPVGAAFLAAVGAASLVDQVRGKPVLWRGRAVPATR
jgi:hypothetical protein